MDQLLSSAFFAYLEQDVQDDISALTSFLEDSSVEMNQVPKHFRYIGERAQLKRFREMFETHKETCLELIAIQKEKLEPKQTDGPERPE